MKITATVKLVKNPKEDHHGSVFIEFDDGELHHMDYKTEYNLSIGDKIELERNGSIFNRKYEIVSPFKEKLTMV